MIGISSEHSSAQCSVLIVTTHKWETEVTCESVHCFRGSNNNFSPFSGFFEMYSHSAETESRPGRGPFCWKR